MFGPHRGLPALLGHFAHHGGVRTWLPLGGEIPEPAARALPTDAVTAQSSGDLGAGTGDRVEVGIRGGRDRAQMSEHAVVRTVGRGLADQLGPSAREVHIGQKCAEAFGVGRAHAAGYPTATAAHGHSGRPVCLALVRIPQGGVIIGRP